jgi:hypothetical protein
MKSKFRPYIFATSALLLVGAISLSSCKKEQLDGQSSDFLEVEKTNSSFLLKHTGTWCPPCGGWGFTTFQSHIDNYGDTEVLAASVSGSLGGANNEMIFDTFGDAFNLTSTPTFHGNFGQQISASLVNAHKESEVIVNSNYELELEGDKIIVKTTTEFFKDLSGTEYYLSPFIVVDNIIAQQAGHPDGANTSHKKSLVDIANPVGFNPEIFGYAVAGGEIREGYRVNLEFEAVRQPSWNDADISVALVLTTRDSGGNPVFVNAYTKH